MTYVKPAGIPRRWKLTLQGYHADGNKYYGILIGIEKVVWDSCGNVAGLVLWCT